jgi:hypothetical protein
MTIKEEFDIAAHKTGLTDDVDDETTANYIKTLHTTVPHAAAFIAYVDRHVDRQLTRHYRRFNGIDFVDNMDAIAKTKPALKLAWLALIWQSLASGVLVGQADPRFADPASVFTDDFELAAVQYANEAAADEALMAQTSQGFEQMVEEVAESTGFSMMGSAHAMVVELTGDNKPQIPDPDSLKFMAWKVWDLWNMVFTAGAHAYFATGYEIGKARREEAILTGIIEATGDTSGEE